MLFCLTKILFLFYTQTSLIESEIFYFIETMISASVAQNYHFPSLCQFGPSVLGYCLGLLCLPPALSGHHPALEDVVLAAGEAVQQAKLGHTEA